MTARPAIFSDVSLFPRDAKPLASYRKYWAQRFGVAKFLPTSRAEMEALGWDSCDIILVTGDAYVDHPSFGMAVIGRMLENQGFRVGIIAQPAWQSAAPFKSLGKPNLFFGVTAGNMDSMINRYTADRKIRSDDAYTPGGMGGKRPDRAATVYSQRCQEAFPGVPIVLGGIEGSLRRIAHYDYWQDKVRRSILLDSKADILLYGNAERAIVEIAHRLGRKEKIEDITDVRGTAFVRRTNPNDLRRSTEDVWFEVDSTSVDEPGRVDQHVNPYMMSSDLAKSQGGSCVQDENTSTIKLVAGYADSMPANGLKGLKSSSSVRPEPLGSVQNRPVEGLAAASALRQAQDRPSSARTDIVGARIQPLTFVPNPALQNGVQRKNGIAQTPRDKTVVRLPSYEAVKDDPVLYAHANRVLHLETNPGNARALVQQHGSGTTSQDVWITAPPIPLTTAEMDLVFDLPYARSPHPSYADANGKHDGDTKIPAWEMIRFSVNIMRGCFGGCTFCSITEHEGRIIQSRSEESILREVETMRTVPGFTGIVSDLGGPTANMYRIGCKSPAIEAACRKPSCVYPGICSNLNTATKASSSSTAKAARFRASRKF